MSIVEIRRFGRLRGLLALGMLISLVASNAEAVAGDIHDGETHHESMVDALVHHMLEGPRHDHVADWDTRQNPDGPRAPAPADEHHTPGGTDHCSHLHGIGIPASFSFEIAVTVTDTRTGASELLLGTHPQVQPHIPKA